MKTKQTQAGFVMSTEAILLLTLMGIGLLVGIVAMRDALFKWTLAQQDAKFVAADSGNPPRLIGEVIGFDQHETPLIPFIDYDPLGTGVNFRALVGVRDDRFTSRQPVFYSDNACSNNPCLAIAGSETANTFVANILGETGSISYLYALQGGGPTYGVGSGSGGNVRGRLYRQNVGVACGATLNSMWVSQRVVTGNPCVDLNTPPGSPISGAGLANFESAVNVVDSNGTNVLESLTPPFITNMVIDPSTDFLSAPPAGE